MLLNVFLFILKQRLQTIPLVVQTNENHLELSADSVVDVVTIPSPSIQFSVLSDRCVVW